MEKTEIIITEESLAKEKLDLDVKLALTKQALADNDIVSYQSNFGDLEDSVDMYNEHVGQFECAKFLKEENPFLEIAKAYEYTGKKVKTTRNKVTKAIETISIEDASIKFDLGAFIRQGKLDTTILTDIDNLLSLLYLRLVRMFSVNENDLPKKTMFFFESKREAENGGSPDSNTQICKKLQGIIDKTKIGGRITNKDMLFIQEAAFGHDTKGKCTLKAINDKRFVLVVFNVMNHFAAGTPYSVYERKCDNISLGELTEAKVVASTSIPKTAKAPKPAKVSKVGA